MKGLKEEKRRKEEVDTLLGSTKACTDGARPEPAVHTFLLQPREVK